MFTKSGNNNGNGTAKITTTTNLSRGIYIYIANQSDSSSISISVNFDSAKGNKNNVIDIGTVAKMVIFNINSTCDVTTEATTSKANWCYLNDALVRIY